MTAKNYLGNSLLKASGVEHNFTKKEISEYIKCKDDIVYFLKTYVKIVHVDRGLIAFDLYPFQEKLIKHLEKHRFSIIKSARQSGKSVTSLG